MRLTSPQTRHAALPAASRHYNPSPNPGPNPSQVDWDATLGRIALDQAGGHPEDEERMAAYKAFAAPGVPGTSMDRSSGGYSSGSASTAAEANGEAALSGERLQEKQAGR